MGLIPQDEDENHCSSRAQAARSGNPSLKAKQSKAKSKAKQNSAL